MPRAPIQRGSRQRDEPAPRRHHWQCPAPAPPSRKRLFSRLASGADRSSRQGPGWGANAGKKEISGEIKGWKHHLMLLTGSDASSPPLSLNRRTPDQLRPFPPLPMTQEADGNTAVTTQTLPTPSEAASCRQGLIWAAPSPKKFSDRVGSTTARAGLQGGSP